MGHPKQSEKTGLGMKREKPYEKEIRKVSPKQRARNTALHEKFAVVMEIQEKWIGAKVCLAFFNPGKWKHRCPSLDGRHYKIEVDHVNTRNKTNADRYGNLQGLCSWCNRFLKGSVRIDFRPEGMRLELEQLDKLEGL